MEVKKFAITLALVLLAIMFVPLMPQDAAIDCGQEEECDDSFGYVSLYDSYFGK